MTEQPRFPLSRRQLVHGLVRGGIGALAGDWVLASDAAGGVASDADLIRGTLGVELVLVFAYRYVLGTGKLTTRAQSALGQIFSQEQAHVRVLTAALGSLGEAPPPAPGSVAQAERALAPRHPAGSLSTLGDQPDCLRLLYDVESIAIGAYHEALMRLETRDLIRTVVAVLGAEAQHATIVGGLLHPGDLGKAVPTAFVEGKR